MITRYLHALLRRTFGRYLVIGGSVYVFEIVVILAAQSLQASPVLAVSLSYWLGTVVSFLLQKVFTFEDTRMHHRILLPQAIAVGILIVFNYGFTVLLTRALDEWLPVAVIRTIALGITVMWNFYIYKTAIFKQKQPKDQPTAS